MPEWTIAKTEEEYLALAVSLVEDDGKREALATLVKHIDLESVFFSTGREHMFVDTVQAIYDQHETMVASGERVLDAEQWVTPRNGVVPVQPAALAAVAD
jgi:hypothetical protein